MDKAKLKSHLDTIIPPELAKTIADEATAFIRRNPWAAVLGAAAIGYLLGATRGPKR